MPHSTPSRIVRGRGDPTERAVVSTASYEARAFGVGSGMPLRLATRKSPTAVILPRRRRRIRGGLRVMAALRGLDRAVVEALGWDEAFVGGAHRRSGGFAGSVQAQVLAATGLHCSAGHR
jgi:DNA polymerase IV